MSFIGTLRHLFRRAPATTRNPRRAERAAGVRTDSDSEHRIQRINDFVTTMSDPTPARITELMQFLDQWVIYPTSSGWIPAPGWDDEPLLTRDAYPTREDAVSYVESLGGTVRPGRVEPQSIDRA